MTDYLLEVVMQEILLRLPIESLINALVCACHGTPSSVAPLSSPFDLFPWTKMIHITLLRTCWREGEEHYYLWSQYLSVLACKASSIALCRLVSVLSWFMFEQCCAGWWKHGPRLIAVHRWAIYPELWDSGRRNFYWNNIMGYFHMTCRDSYLLILFFGENN